MKYLILLLLPIMAFAEMKVEVSNLKTGQSYGAEFDTEEEADAWIKDNKKNNSWGKKDRWLVETDGSHSETREVLVQEALEERVVTVPTYDADLNRTGEEEITLPASEAIYQTEYFFPKDFLVSKTDISDERAAKRQEKEDEKAERLEIKGYIQDVNNSDKPNWEKKLLKKLIRDM